VWLFSLGHSSAVSAYIEAVRELACELLDLMAEGLRVPDRSVFSRLIRDVDSDSLIRLNHYPPMPLLCQDEDSSPCNQNKVGFGEHSDPQILTILRSNDVGGLQISLNDGAWVPVTPDPATFWVNVGDLLQVGPLFFSYLVIIIKCEKSWLGFDGSHCSYSWASYLAVAI
jgi:gibberellin 2-oxidase